MEELYPVARVAFAALAISLGAKPNDISYFYSHFFYKPINVPVEETIEELQELIKEFYRG